jgi:hypothetical protein
MQDEPLVQGGPERPMQAVLQVEVAAPEHDMRKQVAVEGGVLSQQGLQVELALGGDQLVEPKLARRDLRPVSWLEPVLGVRTLVPYRLEDHPTESTAGLT